MYKTNLKEEKNFKYFEVGEGDHPLVLVHGLMGGLSNFDSIVRGFKDKMRILIPVLPIFDLPLRKANISGLKSYLVDFIKFKQEKAIHLLGNSLGGHLALLFSFENEEIVRSITLTGSSGLFENAFGKGFPKRNSYEFIKRQTAETFYDPAVATKELVDEVFAIVSDRGKALKVVATAKSAIRHNVEKNLPGLDIPTLLIWGKNDIITPPEVGEQFHKLLPDSELVLLDKCGHAPMMERPKEFNFFLNSFFDRRFS